MRGLYIGLVQALVFVLALPALLAAQSQFTGQVRDESGGVLPGVTVEAASPALIEKRSAVTDDKGRYTIVDLRPGTYRMTFTLTGFSTVVRDGVELPELRGDDQRRHEGRRAGRNHHRLGPDAAGRRHAGGAHAGAHARHHRLAADDAQHHVGRQHGARHPLGQRPTSAARGRWSRRSPRGPRR